MRKPSSGSRVVPCGRAGGRVIHITNCNKPQPTNQQVSQMTTKFKRQ